MSDTKTEKLSADDFIFESEAKAASESSSETKEDVLDLPGDPIVIDRADVSAEKPAPLEVSSGPADEKDSFNNVAPKRRTSATADTGTTSASSSDSAPRSGSAYAEVDLEDRIKDDLKMAFPGSGVLEITYNGFGFLRPKFTPSPDDIYVSQSQIRKFWLRPGDHVEGLVRPPKQNEKFHGLLKIEKINGIVMNDMESYKRKRFDDLTSMYPNRQIKLETESDILSTRIIDLVAPVGFGQRGMIVSPPKAGKTTVLKNIANGITTNYPDAHLIAILIGERPEEVTDITRSIKAEVIASHFDQSPRDQIKAAEIAMERAKRLVEVGRDVIILLDSVTRLARAYNFSVETSGRTLSGGFDPAALYPAKKFLGAARNCEEGGSLTILGTALVNTESRMDDLIYEEFKGTGNMEIHLDRKYAEKRIFPAIDIQKSGTRHDELLMDADTMDKVTVLRRMLGLLNDDERLQLMIDKLAKTKTNQEFLDSLKNGK